MTIILVIISHARGKGNRATKYSSKTEDTAGKTTPVLSNPAGADSLYQYTFSGDLFTLTLRN